MQKYYVKKHARRNQAMESLAVTQVYGFKISQAVPPLGSYIVDFVCIEKKLIIELDGGQHNEDTQQEYDKRRTEFLNGLGFNVIIFWNNGILLQFDAVMDLIYKQACNLV